MAICRHHGRLSRRAPAVHAGSSRRGRCSGRLGRATDDEELEAEGQVDQAEGNLKQAGDKAKDALS